GWLRVLARSQLRRGHSSGAAFLVGGGGMLSLLAFTALQPALSSPLVVVVFLIAAVFFQYAPPQHTRYYLAGCCASSVLVAILGKVMPETTRLPSGVLEVLRFSSLMAILTFALVMLGQFSNRLQDMFAQLRAAYATLERQHTDLVRLSSQHALILNSAGEGIFGVDAEGIVTFVNPAVARMFGCDAEELVGQRIRIGSHQQGAHGNADFLAV